jgi:hypothetical protein
MLSAMVKLLTACSQFRLLKGKAIVVGHTEDDF